MNRKIAIVGAGGLGREILSLIRALPEWDCAGFFDDALPKGQLVGGLPVLGGLSDIRQDEMLAYVLAVGSPAIKQQILHRLPPGLLFATLVHPRAILQDAATMELLPGVVIGAGCVLTTSIRVGSHTLINLNCTLGHDVTIGVGCSLMPGVHVAGEVEVGDYVLVGSGANLLNGLQVGAGARVGAGAVVTTTVAADTTVVGVPAKRRPQ